MLDETLPFVVARMRFACENELNRALFVAHEFQDVIELLENQGRAFVGRETAGETNGQGVGIQQLIKGNEVVLRQPLALNEQTPARKFDQLAAQVVTQRPNLFVGDEFGIGQSLPEVRRVNAALPARPEFAPPETPHRTFHPAQQMHAVRDVANRDFVGRFVRIETMPHLTTDLAVQFAHSVGCARNAQCQHCHAERFVGVLGMNPA